MSLKASEITIGMMVEDMWGTEWEVVGLGWRKMRYFDRRDWATCPKIKGMSLHGVEEGGRGVLLHRKDYLTPTIKQPHQLNRVGTQDRLRAERSLQAALWRAKEIEQREQDEVTLRVLWGDEADKVIAMRQINVAHRIALGKVHYAAGSAKHVDK